MLSEIGRKLVMTKSWRWMPGMLTLGGDRVKSVTDDGRVFLDRGFVTLDAANNWCVAYPTLDWSDFPNAQDPATRGAMLEVLRRATGMVSFLSYQVHSGCWFLELYEKDVGFVSWDSQLPEEALLSAFEALDAGLDSIAKSG